MLVSHPEIATDTPKPLITFLTPTMHVICESNFVARESRFDSSLLASC